MVGSHIIHLCHSYCRFPITIPLESVFLYATFSSRHGLSQCSCKLPEGTVKPIALLLYNIVRHLEYFSCKFSFELRKASGRRLYPSNNKSLRSKPFLRASNLAIDVREKALCHQTFSSLQYSIDHNLIDVPSSRSAPLIATPLIARRP